MSRTRLCVGTAAVLAAASASVMAARYAALGPEAALPRGPDTWKVTMLVQGKSTGDARLVTTAPLDGPRQHVAREQCHGDGFTARHQGTQPGGHRSVAWAQRPGTEPGPFRVRYECYCAVPPAHAPHDEAGDPPPDP